MNDIVCLDEMLWDFICVVFQGLDGDVVRKPLRWRGKGDVDVEAVELHGSVKLLC